MRKGRITSNTDSLKTLANIQYFKAFPRNMALLAPFKPKNHCKNPNGTLKLKMQGDGHTE